MQITGLPEGVEVAEIRPPVPNDAVLGGVTKDGMVEMCRCPDDFRRVAPQMILKPAPGYTFRDAVSRLGYSIVKVIRVYDTPVTECLWLTYSDAEQQQKAAPYVEQLRSLGVLS
jgi:hypothetical protein